ncbi:peptidylprolyl isomerase [Exilibacterium tricleocarpae]|uniref:Peptidyl-prolyl cis-trans isomerase n=1 Tax=Exilibacterium tricleocarpae TaxID=2591008 RepID=A0A545UBF4_9GAMM|nr:peptidylprolyl isomerase [Exilibacterium tricleocarpae]TQV86799.1 peptidylprolyl isomerase [Exilibacterium tricleocarpae]
MNISAKKVASIHYTLTNDAGEVLDTSKDQEPLAYLHGAQNLVPGLEKELEGKAVGDKLDVVVEPAEGYGEKDPQLIQAVPRTMFGGTDNIEVGMAFHAETQHGRQTVEVVEVDGDNVTVDGNHPLAGVRLNFAVEVTDIREATEEELQHGHVHSAGGCGHSH